MEYYLTGLLIAAGLGLIPAQIAKNKGYSFGLWWFYGWMLFIVAIIHVNFVPDKNAKPVPIERSGISTADELQKYRKLLEDGVLTQEEYDAKKKQLLNL